MKKLSRCRLKYRCRPPATYSWYRLDGFKLNTHAFAQGLIIVLMQNALRRKLGLWNSYVNVQTKFIK